MVFKKTLIHVYTNQYPFGFPEFVRGILFLLNYANKNEMVVQVNLVNHAMSEYVIVNNFDIQDLIPKIYYENKDKTLLLNELQSFQENTVPSMAITTNMGIHKNEIDPVSVIQFNHLISFTQSIKDQVTARLTSDLINAIRVPSLTEPYNVLNMYLGDTKLDRSQIQSLSTQVRNSLDKSMTTIVISSSEYIRRTLTEFMGGCHVPLSGEYISISVLQDSIVDFLIVSKSKKIYTFTEYNAKLKKVNYNVTESTSLSILTLPELYYITTNYAGVYPEAEYTDGTSLTAAFAYPCGLTEDSLGNVYVADTMNNNIRRISTDGAVTTVAGSQIQSSGTTDGRAQDSLFFGPTGITINGATNTLYVLDAINGLIRSIGPDGSVTTLAGSTAGFQDGTGSSAQFKFVYATNP